MTIMHYSEETEEAKTGLQQYSSHGIANISCSIAEGFGSV